MYGGYIWFLGRHILVYVDMSKYTAGFTLTVPVPQYFLPFTHGTSSRMQLDSNNCVVGLMLLDKILRMEERKVLRQRLS